MVDVINDTGANAAKPKLIIPDALNVAVMGIGALASLLKATVGDMPYAVEVQIATVTEYLDMLIAQPEINAEKDSYMTGVTHGALISIWTHLQLLGYVAEIEPALVTKNKNSNSSKPKK